MNPTDAALRDPAVPLASRLPDRLAVGFGWAGCAVIASLAAGLGLDAAGSAGRLHSIAAEALRSGVAGGVLAALLLALAGLVGCAAMSGARQAPAVTSRAPTRSRAGRWHRLHVLSPWLQAAARPMSPGRMARVGQGTIVPVLAGLAVAAAVWLRPGGFGTSPRGIGLSGGGPPWAVLPAPADAYVLGGILLGLAFPALVAERSVAAIPPRTLPEAPALRCLLLLPILALCLGGLVTIARGMGYAATWVTTALDLLLVAIGLELALRALARWFLPAPADPQARAAVISLLAMLAAGVVGPRGAAGEATPLRSHFGLDFSRSWALGYLRRAAIPAVVLTAAFCWALSGVTLVPLDRRDVYESYGAPVAVFGPGLHLGLPWPLGRVRPVELGIVHSVALGGAALDSSSAPISVARGSVAQGSVAQETAEAPAGPQDDRLWTGSHPAEADYLIASPAAPARDSAEAAAGAADAASRAGFQIISADLRVLWRVGLTAPDARRAAYAAADPDRLVRAQAGRVVARFFAARTLDDVMNERRETMAAELRAALVDQVAAADAGIEILAVVVEAVHPPAGAADAYHAVQAAQIDSRTSISTERGRAHGTDSLAHEAARTQIDTAAGSAAEAVGTARADATRFGADIRARAAAGQAFLVERYFGNLAIALAKSPLTVIDDRLGPQDAPVIDLRPPAALALAPAGPGDPD